MQVIGTGYMENGINSVCRKLELNPESKSLQGKQSLPVEEDYAYLKDIHPA